MSGVHYGLFASERGREMFRILDREGRVPKAFPGSWDLKLYLRGADSADGRVPIKMCEELADAQPALDPQKADLR